MPSSYTPSLRLERPADGEQANIWGDTLNTDLAMIDLAIAGITNIDLSNGSVTLSANNGADDQARRAILILSGALSTTPTVTLPPVSKVLNVYNNTSGAFNVILAVAGGGSVSLTPGFGGLYFCDSANIYNLLQSSMSQQLELSAPISRVPLTIATPYNAAVPGSGLLTAFYNGTFDHPVGSISTDGGGCSFNTLSDERLKDQLVPLVGALDRLAALRAYRGVYRAQPQRTVDMMLAHEVAEVVPEAVVGARDAVDADGSPIYQVVDHTKLVPLLVAALQETQARLARLEDSVWPLG